MEIAVTLHLIVGSASLKAIAPAVITALGAIVAALIANPSRKA